MDLFDNRLLGEELLDIIRKCKIYIPLIFIARILMHLLALLISLDVLNIRKLPRH